jgi:hypothetical protein
MRRHDRAITEDDARTLLHNGEYGVLATVSPDGRPYAVPLNYAFTGDLIFFHSAPEGHKLDNMAVNERVSFCVVGKTQVMPEKFSTRYESVIAFGKACEATGDEKQRGLTELLKKYCAGFMKEGLQYIERDGHKTKVYKIVVESFTGKARK